MSSALTIAEMEAAHRKRDRAYDGVFWLGVRTTGVFCRPSCAARKPKPVNVTYFSTPREALFAGYRPCKRCRPMAAPGNPPAWVERLLAEVDRNPDRRYSDAVLRGMHVDPARARRWFRGTHGMTFQAYCRSRRLGRALGQIRSGAPLDDVALGSGFESHSGFRDAFTRAFGGPPGSLRRTEALIAGWIETPLGPLVAVADGKHLVLLEFTERRMLEAQFATLRRLFRKAVVPGENAVLRRLRLELGEYFRGRRKEFTVPVEYPGSPFQKKVWNELRRVPYGATIAYEDLARRVRSPRAARAVGRSNGLNRIAILIPCHRVLNKGGGLGGYGGGLWRKQALLELERGGPARRRGIHAAVNARALQRHTRPEGLLSKAG